MVCDLELPVMTVHGGKKKQWKACEHKGFGRIGG